MDRTDILLAEDDVDDYQFFVEAFEKISRAYNITRAKNGLECITYLKTQAKPGVIFLDLNIPIKNGLECLKFIKDNEALSDIPVIIYSTSHYIKHIDAAFKNGAHSYIIKPSDANDLVEMLNTLFYRLNENPEVRCKESFVIRKILALEN
ncbi:MAG: response regulator receiver protein [Segetibacter sp.]|nr:response regulator receiver protein [Segetibacter sp.]